MSSRRFVSTLLILGLSFGCGAGQNQLKDIPIVVSEPGNQIIDIGIVIKNAQQEVERNLPGADLNFFSLTAECKSLSELQGDIRLHFSQTRLTLFGERVFTARVVVDTIQQKLQMQIQDETEQDLTTEKLELDGLSAFEIASALENYLDSVGKCNDTVVLARGNTNRLGPSDVSATSSSHHS